MSLQQVRSVPGVERAAVANAEVLSGGMAGGRMTISFAHSGERFVTDRAALVMRVGPGFFSTLGTHVIAGRDFDERDVRAAGREADALALGDRQRELRAAVLQGSQSDRLAHRPRQPARYGHRHRDHRRGQGLQPPHAARRSIGPGRSFRSGIGSRPAASFYVKTRGAPESAFAPIRAAVARVAPALPAVELTTFDEQIERSLRSERMLAALSSGFGLVALLLSVVGLYGVMAFVVTQRRQEIGVRLALGATRGAAVWLVVRDALIDDPRRHRHGAALGVGAPPPDRSAALRRAAPSTVRPSPSPASLLALVALAGALIPAWRAASVSPTEALRLE